MRARAHITVGVLLCLLATLLSAPVAQAVPVEASDTDAMAATISHRASATSVSGNTKSFRITVPASVQAGDGLVMFLSINSSTASVSAPGGGWTQLDSVSSNTMRTVAWRKVAGSDAGTAVTVGLSSYAKGQLVVHAYDGTSTTDPVSAFAVLAETVSRTTHTTARVQAPEGGWLLSYWADKSASNSSWEAPAGQVRRDTFIGDGSGRIATLSTDGNAVEPAGTVGGLTATSAASSNAATMWSLTLAPATTGETPVEPPAEPGFAWGSSTAKRPGETDLQSLKRIETAAGRRFDTVRIFVKWDEQFPTQYHRDLRDSGRELLLSVAAVRLDGTVVKWADIAAARGDDPLAADVARWAARIEDFGGVRSFTFSHEAEIVPNIPRGDAGDFIAAWRTMATALRNHAGPDPQLMWIATAHSFSLPSTDRRAPQHWYPGDAWVDIIAADAYNWFTCRPGVNTPWRSLRSLIEPMRRFSLDHPDKTLWLAEWASAEDPAQPQRKGQWIRDAQAMFKEPAYSRFAGVSWFNVHKKDACQWTVTSSAAATTAFAEMAQDPAYAP